MTDQNRQGHFIRRILWLLRLLEENHLEPGHIPESGWPPPGLSPEEQGELEAVQSAIRFMDEMPGGFFIYYAGGEEQVIYANQGMLRLFQCDTLREFRDLTGNSFKGIVHPEDLDGVEASIRKQIAENHYDLDYVEYRIRRKDGSILWVEDYGHFIHAGEAGDVFYVFLGDPADERSRQMAEQEQALREALEKADLAVKAKNAFLSQISHEMRTPLNAIFGFMTLAKTTLADPAAAASYLEQAEAASHQLLGLQKPWTFPACPTPPAPPRKRSATWATPCRKSMTSCCPRPRKRASPLPWTAAASPTSRCTPTRKSCGSWP